MAKRRFESVELLQTRFHFFPVLLKRRGQQIQVASVDACRMERGKVLTASQPRYPLPFHRRRAFRLFRQALKGLRNRRVPRLKRGKARRFRLAEGGAT